MKTKTKTKPKVKLPNHTKFSGPFPCKGFEPGYNKATGNRMELTTSQRDWLDQQLKNRR